MITIELTDKEAELFKKFRQYQDQFQTLIDAGVFHIRGGQATIDLNNESSIMLVHVSTIGFKRARQPHTLGSK